MAEERAAGIPVSLVIPIQVGNGNDLDGKIEEAIDRAAAQGYELKSVCPIGGYNGVTTKVLVAMTRPVEVVAAEVAASRKKKG